MSQMLHNGKRGKLFPKCICISELWMERKKISLELPCLMGIVITEKQDVNYIFGVSLV